MVRPPPTAERDGGIGRPTSGFGIALSWSYLLTSGRIVGNLLVALILARMLGPEAFGVVAIAGVYVFFIEMIARQGLVAAIVQRPNLAVIHVNTAFWMTMVALLLLVPLTIVLSPWWAAVNGLPELRGVILALSPILVMKGMSVVPEALLRRQMEFRLLAIRANVAVLLGAAVGVGAAVAGAGYWALVVQQLTTAAVEIMLLWWVSTWTPRLQFSRHAARDLLGFSGHSAMASFGVFLYQRSDVLLIGLFFGPIAVGLYRMASRFTEIILDLSTGAIMAASLPELSRHQADADAFRARAIMIIRIGALVAIPLLGVLAASSDAVMRLLGDRWLAAAAPLKLLCMLGVIQAITNFTGPLLQAWGRPGVLAITTWVAGFLSAMSFTVAGWLLQNAQTGEQVTGLAAARLVAFAVMTIGFVLPLLKKTVGLRIGEIVGAVARVVTATVLGALPVWMLATYSPLAAANVWLSALGVATMAIAMIGGLTALLEPMARRAVIAVWEQLSQGHRTRSRAIT